MAAVPLLFCLAALVGVRGEVITLTELECGLLAPIEAEPAGFPRYPVYPPLPRALGNVDAVFIETGDDKNRSIVASGGFAFECVCQCAPACARAHRALALRLHVARALQHSPQRCNHLTPPPPPPILLLPHLISGFRQVQVTR